MGSRMTVEQRLTTVESLTARQIEKLHDEACAAGDVRMAHTCSAALRGDMTARTQVVMAIRHAAAQV